MENFSSQQIKKIGHLSLRFGFKAGLFCIVLGSDLSAANSAINEQANSTAHSIAGSKDHQDQISQRSGVDMGSSKELLLALEGMFGEFQKDFRISSVGNSEPEVKIEIQFSSQLPSDQLSSLTPMFNEEGEFEVLLRMDHRYSKNSVFLLEELARLKGIFNFGINWKVDQDGQVLPLDEFMGLGIHQSSIGLSWAELWQSESKGSQLAAREMGDLELRLLRYSRYALRSFRLFKKLSEQQLIRDVGSLAAWHKIKISNGGDLATVWTQYYDGREKQLIDNSKGLAKRVRLELSHKKNLLAADAEKAINDRQNAPFNNDVEFLYSMVASNDREGVARLLETFMPWQMMEPFEFGIWKEWVSAIRSPNRENSILLFRGVDSKNKLETAGKEKDALGFESHSFYSNFLGHGRGSLVERIQSYKNMREAIGLFRDQSITRVIPKISTIMRNHASNAHRSPFISFTLDPKVAASFVTEGGGFLVARIDTRRTLPNIMSALKHEFEVFVPLIVFPDEVVSYNLEGSSVPLSLLVSQYSSSETNLNQVILHKAAFQVFHNAQNHITSRPQSCRAVLSHLGSQ